MSLLRTQVPDRESNGDPIMQHRVSEERVTRVVHTIDDLEVELVALVLGASVLSGLLALALPSGRPPSGPQTTGSSGSAARETRENDVDS